jgi:cellulose synthase/poly-beta-1,6-N-acetylglucosamine synthase-like glycosyltransferase
MDGGALLLLWQVIVVYLAARNLRHGFLGLLGLRSAFAGRFPDAAVKDLLEQRYYKPLSMLVPAFNEEARIVPGLRTMLTLEYPEFEVVVANDGSTDGTLDRMIDAFALVEVPQTYRRTLDTGRIRRLFRSLRHPNLVVVDKEHGGRADALNAAVNVAQSPLICSVDARSLLDAEGLLHASRLFLEDETVAGVAGTVRPLNGAVVRDGRVVEAGLPGTWVERFQALEHARARFTSRSGGGSFGALLTSGGFGVFRRDSVIAVGGYAGEPGAEDLELILRFHRRSRRERRPYRIAFRLDPVCWTRVPSDVQALRRQRNRFHRASWRTLWRYRGMLFSPRYGKLGMLHIPSVWLFEALSPLVEVTGLLLLPVTLVLGVPQVALAALFGVLAFGFGILLSQLAVGVETTLPAGGSRLRARAALFAATILEFLGYHQLLAAERLAAPFRIRREPGPGGASRRAAPPSPAEPFDPRVRTTTPSLGPANLPERRTSTPG